MVYSPAGRFELLLTLGCMTSNFLYLSNLVHRALSYPSLQSEKLVVERSWELDWYYKLLVSI